MFRKLVRNWLENCQTQFELAVYRRYVDNKFLLFRSTEHVGKFKKYLNKQHKKSALTSAIEQYGSLSFLDIKISRETNKLVTSVHRKPKFSDFFTNLKV